MRRLVVEADGGSRGNPGPAGYGAVVRDAETGEVLAERAEFLGRTTNNVAEYRGLIAGLEAAASVDPSAQVEVRMDSRLAVEQMSGRWKVKNAGLAALHAEARAVLPASQVVFRWIPRERNTHADRLANEAMDAGERGEPWAPGGSGSARHEPPNGGRAEANRHPNGGRADANRHPNGGPADATRADGGRPDSNGQADGGRLDADRGPEPVAAAPNRLLGWDPDIGTPTTLVLLRHGETQLTAEQRFSGTGDDPGLTQRGQAQAARAAELLARRGGIDAVVASPLLRAQQTALAVAEAVGEHVRTVDELRECEFGAWEGCTLAEVSERWPEQLRRWLASTAENPPGGESLDELAVRVARARDRLLARYPARTVVAVTHSLPVRQLVRLALDAPPHAVFRLAARPASISVVRVWSDGGCEVRILNDTSHLR